MDADVSSQACLMMDPMLPMQFDPEMSIGLISLEAVWKGAGTSTSPPPSRRCSPISGLEDPHGRNERSKLTWAGVRHGSTIAQTAQPYHLNCFRQQFLSNADQR